MHVPYQISQLSSPSAATGPPNCLLCQNNKCQHVFFPCEHVCVCEECIISNQFVETEKMKYQQGGYNQGYNQGYQQQGYNNQMGGGYQQNQMK